MIVARGRKESGFPDVYGDGAALNVDGGVLGGGHRGDGQKSQRERASPTFHRNRLFSDYARTEPPEGSWSHVPCITRFEIRNGDIRVVFTPSPVAGV